MRCAHREVHLKALIWALPPLHPRLLKHNLRNPHSVCVLILFLHGRRSRLFSRNHSTRGRTDSFKIGLPRTTSTASLSSDRIALSHHSHRQALLHLPLPSFEALRQVRMFCIRREITHAFHLDHKKHICLISILLCIGKLFQMFTARSLGASGEAAHSVFFSSNVTPLISIKNLSDSPVLIFRFHIQVKTRIFAIIRFQAGSKSHFQKRFPCSIHSFYNLIRNLRVHIDHSTALFTAIKSHLVFLDGLSLS